MKSNGIGKDPYPLDGGNYFKSQDPKKGKGALSHILKGLWKGIKKCLPQKKLEDTTFFPVSPEAKSTRKTAKISFNTLRNTFEKESDAFTEADILAVYEGINNGRIQNHPLETKVAYLDLLKSDLLVEFVDIEEKSLASLSIKNLIKALSEDETDSSLSPELVENLKKHPRKDKILKIASELGDRSFIKKEQLSTRWQVGYTIPNTPESVSKEFHLMDRFLFAQLYDILNDEELQAFNGDKPNINIENLLVFLSLDDKEKASNITNGLSKEVAIDFIKLLKREGVIEKLKQAIPKTLYPAKASKENLPYSILLENLPEKRLS